MKMRRQTNSVLASYGEGTFIWTARNDASFRFSRDYAGSEDSGARRSCLDRLLDARRGITWLWDELECLRTKEQR